MPNSEIAKKLVQHMVEDCTQTENKGNVCSCTINQVSGLMALETIPETKELYLKEIYPITYEILANIGFLCNRRKIGSTMLVKTSIEPGH